MKITRIKNLLPAPSDGVTCYLKLSATQLKLDGSNNWVDGNTVKVEVWKKKGEEEESQSGIDDFSVTVRGDASGVVAFRSNTYTFSFAASKNDSKYDVTLKIAGNEVETKSVSVMADMADGYLPYPQPSAIHFGKDRDGRSLTPTSIAINCGYRKTVKGVSTVYPGSDAGNIWYAEEQYFIFYRWVFSNGSVGSWSLLYNLGSPYAITVPNNTTNIALEFVMAATRYQEYINDSNTLWGPHRVEITKDGLDGEPGGSGEDGNDGNDGNDGAGISSVVRYYLATTMATGVTRSTDAASWTTSYPQATADKPYVWCYMVTYYTEGKSPTYSNCELIYTYNAGANPNLLEQTNFSSLASMTKWDSIGTWSDGQAATPGSITTGTQAHNAFYDSNNRASSSVEYKDVLRQVVWTSGGEKKLESSTWYTLSFWARGTGCKTFVEPSCVDTSAGAYINGVLSSIGSDGEVQWTFNPSVWKRYTFTFKTLTSFSASSIAVLWRLSSKASASLANYMYLCMPKLEVGMQATGYISNEQSLHTGQPRVRRWALNTQYFKGAPDERYDDSVWAAEVKALYHCIKSHVSTAATKPGTGASWRSYWEEGSYIENLATGLLLVKKSFIENLIASMVQTDYEGNARIEMMGSVFRIFGTGRTYPSIELADKNGIQVLRFYDQSKDDGTIMYDLGPGGLADTVAQDEKITTLYTWYVVGLSDNSDVNVDDAYSYPEKIFKYSTRNSYTYLYKYEAKIVANIFTAGDYCATKEHAAEANGKLFLQSASSASSGKKFIRDITPFTGLLCQSGDWHSTRDPYTLSEGQRWTEGETAVADDYNPYQSPECDFTVGSDGYYVKTIYWRKVWHVTNGIFDGYVVYYSNEVY